MSLFRKLFRWGAEKKQKHSTGLFLYRSKFLSQISLLKYVHARRRRAVLNQNRKEAPSYISAELAGSYTVEAAVILPFFVAAIAVFIFFFQIMELQWGVQRALEYTSRLFALTSCHEEYFVGEYQPMHGVVTIFMKPQLKKEKVPADIIDIGTAGMNYTLSSAEGNYIDLKVDYTVEFPLRLFGRMQWRITQEARNRKWVGYDPTETDGDENYVYITPHGTVYHKSANCSYLNPSIQSVSEKELDQKRNKDGSRYNPCGECSKRESTSSVVYLTDYGTAWHRALNCSGLKRTVYRISIESAKGYKACGKCAG